ncbi:MAG: DNA methyltransferase [bacterium]
MNDFIEDTLSKLVQEEISKRQYYRPVYSLHKWWARRPGALFRAIVLLMTGVENEDTLFLSSQCGINERSGFFQSHSLNNIIIFDPFMGGGATIVESNRLGAKVIGNDLNPVSFWIVRETLKKIDIDKLKHYFNELDKTAGKEIKKLYKTDCPIYKVEENGMYFFWVRTIECPICKTPVPLFKHQFLNKGIKRNKMLSRSNPAIVVCPLCFTFNEWYGEDCNCRQCNFVFNPDNPIFNQGYFICRCDKKKHSLINLVRKGAELKERLIAIEYLSNRTGKRLYKQPDEKDIKNLERLRQEYEKRFDSLDIPEQNIPAGSSSARWRAHQFKKYYQVFNFRQLLAFDLLISAIKKIPESCYREAFATVFSNSLEYNNMMTPYNYPHRKLHHLFNYHALPLTTMPVENCVWGVNEEGAGTFINCFKRYINAKRYCQKPFDKFKTEGGSIKTIHSEKETIYANFVDTFEKLQITDRGVLLLSGDSSDLPSIPGKSVDLIITDPPYFDNIHYSELSNFFYVWIKKFDKNGCFSSDYVPTDNEAIVNQGANKDSNHYCTMMTNIFRECNRVLKDSGKLIFTFHHVNPDAWWVIAKSLVDSQFTVVDSFPTDTEYKVNPHIREKESLDMDLVIICDKFNPIINPQDINIDHYVSTIFNEANKKQNNSYYKNRNKLLLCAVRELLKMLTSHSTLTDSDKKKFLECFDKVKRIVWDTLTNDQGIKYSDVQKSQIEQLQLF